MITYKIYTDVGNREINEDSVGEIDIAGRYCFALADGLGGHGRGECASAMAVETALNMFAECYSDDFLDRCFQETQQNVLNAQISNTEFADMKTTMVLLTIDEEFIRWGYIGDSRLYHFNKFRIVERTLDHSVPQMLVNIGEIKEKEIRGHEDRNRLLRVIGSPWNGHSYELSNPCQNKKNHAFLLCTDGFWELIEEKKMMHFLKKSETVDEWMDKMVTEVRLNGKEKNMDNNSAIAVWVEG